MDSKIYQADYLFWGDDTLLKDAWLKVNETGRILEIGEGSVSDENLIKVKGGLSPSFVNCHCHLELSHLHQKVEMHGGLHEFIPSLQSQRKVDQNTIDKAIQKWDKEMWENGISAVGDITNGLDTLSVKSNSPIHYHNFIELFGLRSAKAAEIFENGNRVLGAFDKSGLKANLVPHSPYAVSDPLFKIIAKASEGNLISIHNQETLGERQMFEEGNGPLQSMLENFGNDPKEISKEMSNSLLHALHFFPADQKISLVHNTFTEAEDIEAASSSHQQLYWCFCPQANWYIEKRLPKLPLFIEHGLKCTLGTDSLASNHDLCILEEMKLIKAHYPGIKTATLMSWACENGAEFLEEDELGKLEVGKACGLNQISGLDATAELTKNSKIKRLF